MKKILSLLLILALSFTCVFAFVGCGEEQTPDDDTNNNNNPPVDDNPPDDQQPPVDDNPPAEDEQSDLDVVASMYANSHPTKVTSVSSETLGSLVLNRTDVLTTGTVNGLSAAVYETKADKMRTIEEGGATSEILDPTYTEHTILHYLEGKGTRKVDPATGAAMGRWNAEQTLVPERGAIALNLDKDVITAFEYKDNVLTFTVAAADTETVLGQAVAADVAVSVATDGAVITSVAMSYTLAADTENSVPETKVEISVSYSYDIEYITMS